MSLPRTSGRRDPGQRDLGRADPHDRGVGAARPGPDAGVQPEGLADASRRHAGGRRRVCGVPGLGRGADDHRADDLRGRRVLDHRRPGCDRRAWAAEGSWRSVAPVREPSGATKRDLVAQRGLTYTGSTDAGWSSSVARWAHNPEVAGSNPAPATKGKDPVPCGPGPFLCPHVEPGAIGGAAADGSCPRYQCRLWCSAQRPLNGWSSDTGRAGETRHCVAAHTLLHGTADRDVSAPGDRCRHSGVGRAGR